MALDNFVEMRDQVASPVFRLAKRIEHGLERVLPGIYRSRYELVSFTTTPYAEVRRRVRLQHGALAGGAAASPPPLRRRWRWRRGGERDE